MNIPLAERQRPKKIEDVIGQKQLLGPEGVLRRLLEAKILPSLIFWGPSGSGKTTIARLLAQSLEREFYPLSAIEAGVKEVRTVIEKAKNKSLFEGQGAPVLFIDEIHRFNKGQQDALLGAVEQGWITLIGATTENPSFEIVNALLSRCQVYILEALSEEELREVMHKALTEDELLQKRKIHLEEDALLIQFANGDARKLLNLLEVVVNQQSGEEVVINRDEIEKVLSEKMVNYDQAGEMHYDVISAFIKSIRGSDANAAIYYLARMIAGGEDPKFIARRLLILAAEDVGLANPTALVMANETFDTVHKIGWPEARIPLSMCTLYLATSPKSNSAYKAIDQALALVKETGNLPVPLALRNAPTKLMKDVGYGKNYQYAHDFENNFVNMEFLPDEIIGSSFYKAGKNPKEAQIKTSLHQKWGDKYKI